MIFLSTTSSHEDYKGECDIAVVEMTKELAELILKRAEIFRELHAKDRMLVHMDYFDYSANYFQISYEDDIEEELQANTYDGPAESDYVFPEERRQSTECDQMVLTDDSVYWACFVKHTNIRIETGAIPIAQIQGKEKSE